MLADTLTREKNKTGSDRDTDHHTASSSILHIQCRLASYPNTYYISQLSRMRHEAMANAKVPKGSMLLFQGMHASPSIPKSSSNELVYINS